MFKGLPGSRHVIRPERLVWAVPDDDMIGQYWIMDILLQRHAVLPGFVRCDRVKVAFD
jgi:hypothetical protein